MTGLTDTFHKRPFFFLALSLAAGILLDWFATPPIFLLYPFCFLLVTICIFLYKSGSHLFMILLSILFVALGILRAHWSFFSFAPAAQIKNLQHIDGFRGLVTEAEERVGGGNRYLISTDSLLNTVGWFDAHQIIYLTMGKKHPRLHYGDSLLMKTAVTSPALPANPGAFNMRRYLNLRGIFLQAHPNRKSKLKILARHKGNVLMRSIILPVRDRLDQTIDCYLNPEAAGIVRALILGQRQTIDREVLRNFQKTGVVHVLAISGLHVGFIVLLIYGLLSLLRVPSRWRLLALSLFLIFFIVLVNFKAPVMRASLMIILLLSGREFSRPQDSLQVLGLAAWILLMAQPQQLLMPGFQFSFAAVGGLLLGTPKLKKLAPAFPETWRLAPALNKYIRLPLLASLCAVLATLPLTWYYYGMLQVGAVFVNLIIIPYVGLVVMLAIVFLALSAIPGLPVAGLAWIIDVLIHAMLFMIAKLATLPFIYLRTAHPGIGIVLFVGILLGTFYFYPQKTARHASIFLALLLTLILSMKYVHKNDHLRVSFINVGQGDAALLEFPNGKKMLIDGGDRKFSFDAGDYYVAPFLHDKGIRHIDYLLGTHPHSDHVGGFIFLIENFTVDTLIMNEFIVHSKLYGRLLQTAKHHHVVLRHLQSGDQINADSSTRLYVLHPTDRFEKGAGAKGEVINNSSIVLKVVFGETSFLLTGDAQGMAEKTIDRYEGFLKCDVLKVGHHGSITSSAYNFLRWAKPKYAVISVGLHNKFHHPGRTTLRRLGRFGAEVLRTDRVGGVIFDSDGKTVHQLRWH